MEQSAKQCSQCIYSKRKIDAHWSEQEMMYNCAFVKNFFCFALLCFYHAEMMGTEVEVLHSDFCCFKSYKVMRYRYGHRGLELNNWKADFTVRQLYKLPELPEPINLIILHYITLQYKLLRTFHYDAQRPILYTRLAMCIVNRQSK